MEKRNKERNVKFNLRVILTFFIFANIFGINAAEKKNEIPDFAFPRNVQTDSRERLNDALQSKDGCKALRAVIDLCVANNLVDENAVTANLAIADTVANSLREPWGALTRLLQAEILTAYYQQNRWVYDERKLPLNGDWPEDPAEWSGEMFAAKALQYINRATDNPDGFPDMPIQKISTLITNSENAAKANLTVRDFLFLNSSSSLRQYSSFGGSEIIPFFPEKSQCGKTSAENCGLKAQALLEVLANLDFQQKNYQGCALAVCQSAPYMQSNERGKYLQNWYDKLSDNEASGRILYEIWSVRQGNNKEETVAIYHKINEWLKKFPDSIYSENLKYAIEMMSASTMEVSVAANILPGKTSDASVRVNNINNGYILIYKLDESVLDSNGSIIYKKFPGASKLITSIPVNVEGTVPFDGIAKIELPELTEGNYVAIPSKTSKLSSGWQNEVERWSMSPFNVTGISIITLTNSGVKDSGRIYVVDAATQKPLKGATVNCYKDNDTKKLSATGKTGDDGSFVLPTGYYRIVATYGKSKTARYAGYSYSPERERNDKYAKILTDLSIYRPGDTIGFAVIGWEVANNNKSLVKGEKVKIELRDPNYNIADSVTHNLDSNGRAWGKMTAPKGKLLGRYSLVASFVESGRLNAGVTGVEISDYKLPGFFVTVDKDKDSNYQLGDTIRFKGKIETYSGMPLSNCQITADVKYTQWRGWWPDSGNAGFSMTLIGNDDGQFEILLPTEGLKGTKFANGIYTLNVSAVSPAGETQYSSPVRFSLGKGMTINPSFSSYVCVEGDSIKFNVPVYDMLGLPQVQRLNYVIKRVDSEEIVAKGQFESPTLVLSASALPSGKYKFEFDFAEKESDEESKVTRDVVIYRMNDTKSPVETPLWIPKNEYITKTGEKEVEIKFGSYYPESMILCIVSDSKGIISKEWVKANADIVSYKVPVPSENEKYYVSLSGLHNFNQESARITIVPESSLRKMDVKTVTFRDRLTAGDKERWKFTFSVDDIPSADIMAMAVMTDKALNALQDFKWGFNENISSGYCRTNLSFDYAGVQNTLARFTKSPKYVSLFDSNAGWNTYGYPLAGNYGMPRGVKMRQMSARSVGGEVYAMAEESVLEMEAPKMAMAQSKKAETMNAMAATDDSATAGITEESAEGAAGQASDGSGNNANEQLRMSEMPVAFFMPDLKGNNEGEVSLEFEVPDFNTTWQFQLLGYDEDLYTSVLTLDAVASKPVMVKGNFPLYLRTGDNCTLQSLIFNNTDEDLKMSGRIEIINPSTGEILAVVRGGDEMVAPSKSRIVTIQFRVPDDLTFIVAKVYADSESHTDGEQAFIPVYPSSTPVVEAVQFYMRAEKGTTEVKVPKLNKDANVTLKYCDNPLWEVILSLPIVDTNDSHNSLSIAGSLYALAVSSGVMEKYPYIRENIIKTLSSQDSIAIQSNLSKDSNLKIVDLDASPWVNDAARETYRMRNLIKMTERDAVSASKTRMTENLKALQNPDGGWSWCEGMRSSYFITERILTYMGHLRKDGYELAETNQMVKKAISYCDNYICENAEKYDNYPASLIADYLYVRSFFDQGMPSRLKKWAQKGLDWASGEWKKCDVKQKSRLAVLFARSEGYKEEAKEILKSLKQFATVNPDLGWWFGNSGRTEDIFTRLETTSLALEAFAEIEPDSEAVDGLRQWLVLQKETENWGAESITIGVVQAILSSGSDWNTTGIAPKISINGKQIETMDGAPLTGSVTMNLKPSEVSGKTLTIEKAGNQPAWGGIVSQYVAPIQEVKRVGSGNLNITKQVYLVKEVDGKELVTEGNIKVGDKIRVSLTIDCQKDMQYVAVIDNCSACLQPREWISGIRFIDGIPTYVETRNDKTTFFIESLTKGKHVISYDCTVDRSGEYSLGIATAQSQYSPTQAAHSAGAVLKVE